MLTPSGVTLQQYLTAVRSDKPSHVKITFIGQNVVLTDDDIESSGIKLNHYLNGDTALIMGRAVMANITIPVIHTSKVDNLIWSGEFKFEIGQEINSNTTEWTTIGYFTGSRPDKVNSVDVINFTANDRMYKFDRLADKWVSSVTYPRTLQSIFQSLCTYCGVPYVAGNELPNIFSRSFSQSPFLYENKTCRDLLAQIAEACGCYARITADGKCKLVWFADHTSDYTLTEDYEFPPVEVFDHAAGKKWAELESYKWSDLESLRWSDLGGTKNLFRIDSLSVVNSVGNYVIDYPGGMNGNIYTIVDNPFLIVSNSSDINNYIKPILDRFTAFGGYIPLHVNCVGCALIEAGDIINVNADGETFATPIFVKQTVWNGSLTDDYELTGEMNRPEVDETNMVKLSESARYKLIMGQVTLIAQDKYDKQSGIDILPEGIEIYGNKYVKVKSGGIFEVDSSSFMNIESGGALNVKSGGAVSVQSNSSIDVESGGKLNVKSGGAAKIKSGSSLDVESGGALSVESGGNMNVDSGGTLNIKSGGKIEVKSAGGLTVKSGGAVDIQSGSTFDVNATNFSISSTNKRLKSGNWTFDDDGLLYDVSSNSYFVIGNKTPQTTSKSGVRLKPNGSSLQFLFDYTWNGSILETASASLEPTYFASGSRPQWALNIYRVTASNGVYPYANNQGSLGGYDSSQNLYAFNKAYIYDIYGTVHAISSRKKKHNIKPLKSYGEEIDKLNPVSFVYDYDEKELTRYGLIYEEAIEVLPDICEEDEHDKSIKYMELIPVLLKEVQDLRKRVAELEAKVEGRE